MHTWNNNDSNTIRQEAALAPWLALTQLQLWCVVIPWTVLYYMICVPPGVHLLPGLHSLNSNPGVCGSRDYHYII